MKIAFGVRLSLNKTTTTLSFLISAAVFPLLVFNLEHVGMLRVEQNNIISSNNETITDSRKFWNYNRTITWKL